MNRYEFPIFDDLLKMENPKGIISLFKEAGFKIPKDNYNEIIITQREFWLDSIINVIGKKYLFQIDENNFYIYSITTEADREKIRDIRVHQKTVFLDGYTNPIGPYSVSRYDHDASDHIYKIGNKMVTKRRFDQYIIKKRIRLIQ